MFRSKITEGMSVEEIADFKEDLLRIQSGLCFICEQPVDLNLHQVDMDHIIPGLDEKNNIAVTHASCNREKQDTNLEVARAMKRFDRIGEITQEDTDRSPNISNLLDSFGGSTELLPVHIDRDKAYYTLEAVDSSPERYESHIFVDELGGVQSFFASLPIQYVYRDEKDINPRTISDRVKKLVKEFYSKRPQLQVGLARIEMRNGRSNCKVFMFDGQHKAAAQMLLGERRLPLRIFVNPDLKVLMQTNERAGSVLRQVAFDLSVRRQIGSTLLAWRIETFQKDKALQSDDYQFSEMDLLNHFRGELREVKRFILDYVRNQIVTDKDNRLRDYIAFGGKEHDKPLSYSAMNRTFFSILLSKEVLDVRPFFNAQRQNEIDNMVKIMNLVVDEVLPDFRFEVGSWKIEQAVRREAEGKESKHIPDGHLRALRMLKEEIMHNWIKHVKQIISSYFTMQGIIHDEDRILQEKFDENLIMNVRNYLVNLRTLSLWVNRQQSHIFSAKQPHDYWYEVFKNGQAPDGTKLLAEGINLMKMIKG